MYLEAKMIILSPFLVIKVSNCSIWSRESYIGRSHKKKNNTFIVIKCSLGIWLVYTTYTKRQWYILYIPN